MDKYKYKRRQIRELQEDLQTMSNTMDNLTRDENAYTEMIEEKEVGGIIIVLWHKFTGKGHDTENNSENMSKSFFKCEELTDAIKSQHLNLKFHLY